MKANRFELSTFGSTRTRANALPLRHTPTHRCWAENPPIELQCPCRLAGGEAESIASAIKTRAPVARVRNEHPKHLDSREPATQPTVDRPRRRKLLSVEARAPNIQCADQHGMATVYLGIALKGCQMTRASDTLAQCSKALASGASPQGRGFQPHRCHLAVSIFQLSVTSGACVRVYSKKLTGAALAAKKNDTCGI